MNVTFLIGNGFDLNLDLNLDLVAYQPKGSSPGPGSWLMGWVWSK